MNKRLNGAMPFDKYGRGSAAANGAGFVDLAPGDTFDGLEAQLRARISEVYVNQTLGISASIGSNRNANELAKHLAFGEGEEAHKFAAKNVGMLFRNGQTGIRHFDKKAIRDDSPKPVILRVFSRFVFGGVPCLATITLREETAGNKLYAVQAVDITKDVDSERTPRGETAPLQNLTSFLVGRIAYYVGDVNRTRPEFVGSSAVFTIQAAVTLLLKMLKSKQNDALALCPKSRCTGCGACFNRCAKGAISMVPDEEGFAYPKVDAGKCVGCGLCQKACPQLNPSPFHPPMGKKVYAAWAKDDVIRLASSSGGLYTVFAQEIMKRGGLVNGVAYDKDFNLMHRLVDKAEDLVALRGSKYVQSDIGDVYRRVEQALKAGRPVLFTSTPCQVAGLYSFLGKSYDNLITCDFVCHGVPSPTFFKAMVKEVARKKHVADPVAFRFRDDREWGFRPALIDMDGAEYADGVADKLYFKAFLDGCNYRENCYQCKYASFSRVADLTIGDFWGIGTWWPFTHADWWKGVSVLLVNSNVGRRFLASVSSDILYHELRDVRECDANHQLYCPVSRPPCRDDFYARARTLGTEEFSKWCAEHRPPASVERQAIPRLLRSLAARAAGKIAKKLRRRR